VNFADPFAHGAYLTWGGTVAIGTGVLKFDVVEEQGVERTGEVTEHPVEKGAPLTDHYRIKSRSVKLTAFLSQEPVDPSMYPEGGGELTGVEYTLPTFPNDPGALTAGNVINTVTDPSSTIVKAFAPTPPTKFTDFVFAYQNPVDTLAKVGGFEHHGHRRLPQVVLVEQLPSLIGRHRGNQRNRRRSRRDMPRALPHRGQRLQSLRIGDDHEIPWLAVRRRW